MENQFEGQFLESSICYASNTIENTHDLGAKSLYQVIHYQLNA